MCALRRIQHSIPFTVCYQDHWRGALLLSSVSFLTTAVAVCVAHRPVCRRDEAARKDGRKALNFPREGTDEVKGEGRS